MNENKYTYLVEIIYENVVVENNGEENMSKRIELDTQVYTFSDDNKSVAQQTAREFHDKVLRYGLVRSGGSIVKSTVPPSAIKLVGLVDLAKYVAEQSETVTPLVTSNMEPIAEPAPIDDHVDAD